MMRYLFTACVAATVPIVSSIALAQNGLTRPENQRSEVNSSDLIATEAGESGRLLDLRETTALARSISGLSENADGYLYLSDQSMTRKISGLSRDTQNRLSANWQRGRSIAKPSEETNPKATKVQDDGGISPSTEFRSNRGGINTTPAGSSLSDESMSRTPLEGN